MARDAAFLSLTHPLALSPPLALSYRAQKARGTLRKLGQIAPFAGLMARRIARGAPFPDPLDRNRMRSSKFSNSAWGLSKTKQRSRLPPAATFLEGRTI
jgi:hypothetical protein